MIGTLLGILGLAGLFALFGVLRPADSSSRGCHACASGDATGECGAKCPLLKGIHEP
jgi:hypothetical protein